MSKSASQREADEFHMMLGYCIAAWADVDDLLFRIFRECIGPHLQCAIIYYKTPIEPHIWDKHTINFGIESINPIEPRNLFVDIAARLCLPRPIPARSPMGAY
jgi:hypothetical protein